MKFPTGGIVRDPRKWLIWCNSKTDSIVWMREETVKRIDSVPYLRAESFLFPTFGEFTILVIPNRKGDHFMKSMQKTRTVVFTAMLAAVAGVLMSFEFPVPLMPPFYKIDFSDVPAIIVTFLLGPVSGLSIEIIKILIKLLTVGTTTMFVGEFANFLGVFLFIFPLWLVFRRLGTGRKACIAALGISLPIRIAFACILNACITLPLYAKAMGLSLDEVILTVGAVNPMIQNLPLFLVLATVPFNLIKLLLNYVIGYLLYARISASNGVTKVEEKV